MRKEALEKLLFFLNFKFSILNSKLFTKIILIEPNPYAILTKVRKYTHYLIPKKVPDIKVFCEYEDNGGKNQEVLKCQLYQ